MPPPPADAVPAPPRDLARERYGARPSRRRPVTIAVVVGAIVVAVALGWVAWGMLQPRADGEVGRFEVVGDERVDLVLEVTRPVGRTAVCTVEALGAGFAQVGLADIVVDPATTAFSQVEVSIATSASATVATVRSCRLT